LYYSPWTIRCAEFAYHVITGRRTPSPLIHGKLEGWVGLRVAGQTDWKRFWLVISAAPSDGASIASHVSANGTPRKRRLSIFSSSGKDKDKTHGANASVDISSQRAVLQFYAGNKPKERKKAVLSVGHVRQAFAVYPERPEFIARSTLVKVEGVIGGEDAAGSMKNQEGWVLIMPEINAGAEGGQAVEMLRWLTGEWG
jgi:CCR4-NOT transcriptional complex subunit CAF120